MDWNPAAEIIFGYSRNLAIGQDAIEFIALDSVQQHFRLELSRTFRTGRGKLLRKLTEMTAVRANGGHFPIEVTLTRTSDRNNPSFTAFVRDISDRKRAEDILRKSEERFRMLVEGIGDYAIQLLDPCGRILTWNAGVERIDGYRAREIIGRRFNKFYSPDDIARGKPGQAMASAEADGRFTFESWSVCKNGSSYWASVVLTALRNKSGVLLGFSRIARDCTKQKDHEIETRRLTVDLERQLQERAVELRLALETLLEAQSP